MKSYLINFIFYGLLFFCLPCSAQFTDNFSDSNFTQNPSWFGDSMNFEVNSNLQLHLKAPALTGKSLLVTNSEVSAAATWKFFIELDFNPSSSNYAKVYLLSSSNRIDSSLNGYYLRIGGTNDDICLFRQDGLTSKMLIDGRNGMLNASVNKLSVQVARSLEGVWALRCDSTGKENFIDLGTITDNVYFSSKFFGIQCVYTSTRSTKFLFDNFLVTGSLSTDTVPPIVKAINIVGDSSVCLEFNEDMNERSLKDNSSYNLPAGYSISNILINNLGSVRLNFSQSIPCKQPLAIQIKGLSDVGANSLEDTTLFVSFCKGNVYDVLITEIMADPDPSVSLPKVEYLELFNNSGSSINLENWSLQIGSTKKCFPIIELPADSFLLICSTTGCSEFKNPYCLEMLSSSTLNNSGEYMGISNRNGDLIHWVNYDETYYQDELKKDGGWSLEMTDIKNPCAGSENWKASVSSTGGTPGKPNSIAGSITDSRIFQYNHFTLLNDSTLRIFFSKSLDINTLSKEMFVVDNGMNSPFTIHSDSLQHCFADLIYAKCFNDNILYNLQLSENLLDCSGNHLSGAISLAFKKPSTLSKNDILINEVLFDALPGGQEFIEIYNNSDKFLNSSDLRISYRNSESKYNNVIPLGEYSFLIAPKSFLVILSHADAFQKLYSISDNRLLIETKSFPSLNNEEGCIAIMNKNLEILDEFCYSAKMHFPLLANKSGVSLERVRYESLTSDPANWHSASFTENFATPGAQNSQFLEDSDSEKEISLEYEIFSPDNDGYQDIETIFYNLDKPGFVSNIVIYDSSGRRIKILSNNQPMGTQGFYTWDGMDEKGMLAPTGIYLIYIKLHHLSGEVKEYRKTCVLGMDLKH